MKMNILPVVAILIAGFAGPVLASERAAPQEITIKYDRADLNSGDARKSIERKIEFAVGRLCGAPVLGTKEEADMQRDCRAQARSTAWAQVPVNMADNRN